MKPLLAYIQPRVAAGGARTDIRVATGGSGPAAGLGGYQWDAAIVRRPRMSIELLSPTIDGKVSLGRADFVINLGRVRQYNLPRTLYWLGAPVTIYDASTLDLATAPIEFTGYVRQSAYDLETDQLTLNLEVSAQALDKPVLFNEFTGAGGLLGDASLKGHLQPAGFGSVQNVEPVWFDLTRNIGMIDGYGNTTAIGALFEGGSDFGARVADYADYATLAARIDDKTVAPGRWATCVAYGLVGLGAPPVRPITVDATFGSNRIGAIIQRLMTTHAGISTDSIDTAAFTALDAAVNRPAHHWMNQQRQVQDLIETMAASCNATPLMTFQGKFSITRVFGGTNVATIDRLAGGSPRITKWRVLDPDAPTWRMRARAARPGVTLDIDQILYADTIVDRGVYATATDYRQGNLVWNAAGAQFLYINATPGHGNAPPVAPTTSNAYWQQTKQAPAAADLYYADGTPIENLKPAQIASDKTSTNTAAAIAGQAATATSSDFSVVTGATKPADGATNDLGLYSAEATMVINGNNVSATGNLALSKNAYSTKGLVGSAIVTGRLVGSAEAIFGLTTTRPPGGGGAGFRYSFYRSGTGVYAYEVGGPDGNIPQTLTTSASDSDVWSIAYDGVRAYYYRNGTLLRTTPAAADLQIWLGATVSFSNSVKDMTLTAYSQAVDVSRNVLDTYTGTVVTVPRNEIRTPLGTAAAIAGQSVLATNADFSGVTGATKPDPYATSGDAINQDINFEKVGSPNWGAYPSAIERVALSAPAPAGYGYRSSAAANLTAAAYGTNFAPIWTIAAPGQSYPVGVVGGTSLFVSFYYRIVRTIAGSNGFVLSAQADCAGPPNPGFNYTGSPNVSVVSSYSGADSGWLFSGVCELVIPAGSTSANPYIGFYANSPGGANWQHDIYFTQVRWARTAYAATVGGDVNRNIVDTYSGAVVTVPRNEIRTPLGTAAAIAGQGAFATVNSAAYGSGYLTGFAALAARANVSLGDGYVFRADGTTSLTDALAVTSLGTAASITGQAATATSSDFSVVTGTTKPANNATVGSVTGTNLYRSDGTTILSQAEVRTLEGTASAITGQGAFATLNSAGYGSAYLTGFGGLAPRSFAYFGSAFLTEDSAGATQATIANFKTASGTAASIAGQGAFATVNTAAYGSALLTGFAALAARAKVSLGDGFVFRADGTTGLTDSIAVTSLGTAASITGQAATATSSDFSAVTGTTKPSNNADVTAAVTPSLSGNAAFAIAADYYGTITTTLPMTRQFSAFQGTTDVSSTTSWALSGGYDALGLTVNNTSGSSTRGELTVGLNQITASTTPSTGSGTATLTATFPGGGVLSLSLVFTKTNAASPPAGGGSGATSATITSPITAPTSTTSAALSSEVVVRSDAAGKIKVSMDVFYSTSGSTPTSNRYLYMNVAYATTSGGSLTDVFADNAAAIYNTPAIHTVSTYWDDGNIQLPLTQFTLPAANTDYYFKIKGRKGQTASVTPYDTTVHIQQV